MVSAQPRDNADNDNTALCEDSSQAGSDLRDSLTLFFLRYRIHTKRVDMVAQKPTRSLLAAGQPEPLTCPRRFSKQARMRKQRLSMRGHIDCVVNHAHPAKRLSLLYQGVGLIQDPLMQ